MSEHMKRHHTSPRPSGHFLYILDHNLLYAIPKKFAKKYIVETKKPLEKNISAEELFEDMDKEYTEAGSLLGALEPAKVYPRLSSQKKLKFLKPIYLKWSTALVQ